MHQDKECGYEPKCGNPDPSPKSMLMAPLMGGKHYCEERKENELFPRSTLEVPDIKSQEAWAHQNR
jgi:hypothetical protein